MHFRCKKGRIYTKSQVKKGQKKGTIELKTMPTKTKYQTKIKLFKLFAPWEFLCHFAVCRFFLKNLFLETSFINAFRVSNNLGPDQARGYVGPFLGPYKT